MENTQESSLPSVGKNGIILAAALAVVSVVAIALPITNIEAMGFSGGLTLVSPHLLGGFAYLVPIIFLAGLAARFAPQSQPYVRMIEIVGLVVAGGVVLYVIVTLLNGMNEMNNANRQMTQMLGSVAARQFSMSGGMSLAGGSIALGVLAIGSAWQVWTGRR